MHTLTAVWKDPSGKPVSISSDVKIETDTSELNAYWIFEIAPHFPSGIWTTEIKVDGQPAGSHVFELVNPAQAKPVEAAKPAAPAYLTTDQIFRKVSPSLVTVHKLSVDRRRMDSSLGFVWAAGLVATAFQSIDGAAELELEFANGEKLITNRIAGSNRMQDWALLAVETGTAPVLERGAESAIVVGERLTVFNVESEARVIGGIDVTGRSESPDLGPRIQFGQRLSPAAVGGPLLDSMGRAVALMGGTTVPGSRVAARIGNLSPALYGRLSGAPGAIPLSLIGAPGAARSTSALEAAGEMTAPLMPIPDLIYGATSNVKTKNASDPLPADTSDFSRRDPEIFVYTMWQRKSKENKGSVSAKVYDVANRPRYAINPKKFTIPNDLMRVSFSIAPEALPAGIYRVDLFWNEQVVWRTMVRITD